MQNTAALAEQTKRLTEGVMKAKTDERDDYKDIRGRYRAAFPPSVLYGQGYNGYGNGHTDEKTALLYPHSKPRLGRRKTRPLRVPRKDMSQQADQMEELVPVRLEVDWDKIRLRDTFTWNLYDRVVHPDLFAEQLIEDLGLALPAAEPVLDNVKHQLREQLGEFYPPIMTDEDALDPELPYSAYKNDEMRILIKLNITIGLHTLIDQFEWEINNPLNSPEEFAQLMAKDLSLSGEFTTAIAHCIREQSQLFTRSLYIIGHPFDGRPVEDADLVAAFLPSPLPSVFRPQQQAKDYGPYLYDVTENDLEKNEMIFSREQRRQKRSVNRRGGPTLPDLKERQRTVRTLVVSSVLPGAAETIEESRLYKRAGVASGRGKKGAAARDGFELSEDSDSEDSQPDSPAMSHLLSGTARTRGMRGAATAAQQRMANLGRSETPEAASLHHHETRTSSRRFGRDVREESTDAPSLVIKLKLNKEKFRQWHRERKAGARPTLQQTPSHNRASSVMSGHSTPAPGSMGPPTTPGMPNSSLGGAFGTPQAATTPQPKGQIGRVDAPHPLAPGQTAPPPVSLTVISIDVQS
jgi:SWI/SNF-related matrix-associated actin-dependent regulator of chromatin subfamily B protein 1